MESVHPVFHHWYEWKKAFGIIKDAGNWLSHESDGAISFTYRTPWIDGGVQWSPSMDVDPSVFATLQGALAGTGNLSWVEKKHAVIGTSAIPTSAGLVATCG
jgi:hypothetical protein